MNFHNTRVCLFIILLLILSTTAAFGCSVKEDGYIPGKFGVSDLSIYDTQSKKSISYGMTKEEVEKILGQSDGKSQTVPNSFSYGNCSILYRDNKLVLITLNSDESFKEERFVTNRGTKLGDKPENIIDKYGDATTNIPNDITFYFQKSSFNLMLVKEEDLVSFSKDSTDVYLIDFYTNGTNNTISSIYIGDSRAFSTFK
ncbi:MAG: hypothetical protein Q8930_01135 [Bacillota bacterium]|nr:hypothetical protein [Bacillota bacterium]